MFHPLVFLDFESYYSADYTLRTMTTEAYVRDPRFEVLGVGVAVEDGPPVWLEAWEFESWARRFDWRGVTAVAHHAQFDGFILGQRYGIHPGRWACTLSMGRALTGKASLEDLAQHYQVGEKGHELGDFKGQRRADISQARWQVLGGYCRNDVALTRALWQAMAPRFPAVELAAIDLTVRMFTDPVFEADLAVLGAALEADRASKAAFLARLGGLEDARAQLASSEKFAALLRERGEDPPTKSGKSGTIYAFAKSDPGMQALLESPRDEIRHLAEARLAIKSTLIETRVERLMGIAQRGPVPVYLKYAGAHTHRWAGGERMNFQNFNRGGALRKSILAPPGHVIVVADSGQIEARVLAWVAREEKIVETFRRNDATNGDFYSDVGSGFFMMRLSKKETPVERQLAKAMILGLGFGMGWSKFAGELLKGMLGSAPVQFTAADAARFRVDVGAFETGRHGTQGPPRGDIVQDMVTRGIRLSYEDLLVHAAVTHHFVTRYRETNAAIAAYWRQCDEILSLMDLEGPDGVVRAPFGPLKVVRHGLLKPGGLALRYPGLRRGESGFSYMAGRERAHIYGGSLTENIVQSLARDIVAQQAVQVSALGYRIATTTHDEIVVVVPEADGAKALEDLLAVMRTPPGWCATLPLNAEGGVGRSYGEAK